MGERGGRGLAQELLSDQHKKIEILSNCHSISPSQCNLYHFPAAVKCVSPESRKGSIHTFRNKLTVLFRRPRWVPRKSFEENIIF